MSAIAERLSQVVIEKPQVHHNLSLFPLVAEASADPGYLLLDEALEGGCARVTEVSETGSVPELKFVNGCDRPVFLLDGEELVGAKQNRILNLSILVPAGATIVVPVSCVEAGRWHHESEEFSTAGRAHFAHGRARKAARVSESMSAYGTRRSDQSEVWDDIAERSARMNVRSETGAAAALYETHRARLEDYDRAFQAVEGQVGALFAINGRVIGFDLFDGSALLEGLLPKLVRSYALDAIDAGESASRTPPEAAAQLIEAAGAAEAERFPAVGRGEDWRIRGEGLAGGALVDEGRVVHLCVFRLEAGQGGSTGGNGLRMLRSSLRRRARYRV